MVRAVAYAIKQGVNYFNSAARYGDGQSETRLGLVLEELGAEVIIGTKVQLQAKNFIYLAIGDYNE
jgi:aryl-alcohol dehydrogenase-like predicted oxidoreductase